MASPWAASASTGGANPGWAASANQPLVPALDLPNIRKVVARDLREIRRASDEIAKLSKKKGGRDAGSRLLALSTEARERARGTSRTLRESFAAAAEGSPEHAALLTLQEEFKATLRKFQQQAEAAAPLAAGTPADGGMRSPPNSGAVVVDIQVAEASQQQQEQEHMQREAAQQSAQLQSVALNEDIIAEREQGIAQLNHTVHEVAEIFSDMALLVAEQGEHIDNIQTHIESAAYQTNKGVKELAKASRSQKKARGRMCCVAVMLIILLIVLTLVLKFAAHAI